MVRYIESIILNFKTLTSNLMLAASKTSGYEALNYRNHIKVGTLKRMGWSVNELRLLWPVSLCVKLILGST